MTNPVVQPMKDFYLRWAALSAPQRPTEGVAAAMRKLLAERPGPTLQLGVTPEIAHLGREGFAIDWSEEMMKMAWPGNIATHSALIGNWLAMPFVDGCMDVAFGDASLSMLHWPGDYHIALEELRRVLHPSGRIVLRCFVAPDHDMTMDDLVAAAYRGDFGNFGAFKLRLNMAAFTIAGDAPNTGAHIHRLFQRYFSDRDHLSETTGWSLAQIGSIDAYAGALSVHTYPKRMQIAKILPKTSTYEFVDVGDYPLAEHCPLLIIDLAPG